MALYRYIKTSPRRRVRRPAVISYGLMALGGVLLVWTAWPILTFMATSDGLFSSLVSPIAQETATQDRTAFSPVVLAADTQGAVDFTNPNLWFPQKPQKKVVAPVTSYTISIPKLKIVDAQVVISGDDLNQSLIHYGGTGLPGEYGTAVIFGHSTLPQFYSPTNYRSIFSLLPTLKVGDEFSIQFDGVTYRYQIEEMLVTEPNDLTPLEQRFDDSHVTLITCVPPGTYWKRLNVRARLMRL
jgi:sortase A